VDGSLLARFVLRFVQAGRLPHAVFDEVNGAARGISSAACHTGLPPPSYAREGGHKERWLAMRARTVEKKRVHDVEDIIDIWVTKAIANE